MLIHAGLPVHDLLLAGRPAAALTAEHPCRGVCQKVRSPTAAITVVWGAEHRDCVLLMRPIVPVHDQLVRPRYEAQPVVVIELL